METAEIANDGRVAIRRVTADDLVMIAQHPYSVTVTEPGDDIERLGQIYGKSGLWRENAAAVAIVDVSTGRMLGTIHCYRAAPAIHGLELGYLIHDWADRGRGAASRAVRMFSDHLFDHRPTLYRQQLIIEVWNTPSWKVAERCGFVREGILRSSGFGEGDPADCFIYSRTRRDHVQQQVSLNSV